MLSKPDIGGRRRPEGEVCPPAWQALSALSARLWWTPRIYHAPKVATPAQLTTPAGFDPLTGVLNRAGFEQMIALQRAAAPLPLSLLAVDLDDNELFLASEEVQERALMYIAQRIRVSVYEWDIVARVSPREFAVLLLDVHLNCAVRVAQRLCDEIRSRTTRGEWGLPRSTLSLGVTELFLEEPLGEALGRAAIALKNARRRGGDRVGVSRFTNRPGCIPCVTPVPQGASPEPE